MIDILGIRIHLYGLLIGVAIYTAWEIANKVAKIKRLPDGVIDKLSWWLIIGGIIGARFYHVIDFWTRYYSHQPIKIFYLWEGGLGIWGAIIGGLIGLLMYRLIFKLGSKLTSVNYLYIFDSIAVGMPLAQAIGRLGNWANGELYGKKGEPLFAYEALLNVILFAFLWRTVKKKLSPGALFGIYLVGYGVIRATLENYRSDNIIWKIGDMPVAVIFSIASIIIGSLLIFKKK